jgi:ribosomal protein S27AE
MSAEELLPLLRSVVEKRSSTGNGPIGPPAHGSKVPINLDALELHRALAADPFNSVLLEQAERVVDGRHPMAAGECAKCGLYLMAHDDHDRVWCPRCGTEHDVVTARFVASNTALTTWLTAAEVERSVSRYGKPIKATRIRQWAARGRLSGINGRYRLADVLRLADGG